MSKHIYAPPEKFILRAKKHEHKKSDQDDPSAYTIPSAYSLQSKVPGIYDQGQLGSCTANALCAAYRILEKDQTFLPSRLWVYFYERLMEDPRHNINDLRDSGADAIDGESYIKTNGVCSELLWPYDISKYNDQPPANCTADALTHKLTSYKRILFSDIKSAVAAGFPVLIAIAVYQSFENSGANIPMPNTNTEQLLGGHELCLVGYDDTKQVFTVQNSWGAAWGDNGFCYIPYAYLADPHLCYELTVIKLYSY